MSLAVRLLTSDQMPRVMTIRPDERAVARVFFLQRGVQGRAPHQPTPAVHRDRHPSRVSGSLDPAFHMLKPSVNMINTVDIQYQPIAELGVNIVTFNHQTTTDRTALVLVSLLLDHFYTAGYEYLVVNDHSEELTWLLDTGGFDIIEGSHTDGWLTATYDFTEESAGVAAQRRALVASLTTTRENRAARVRE